MNRVPFKGIMGPTYTLDSLNAECQRCVNMFLERIESGDGKNAYWLRPTPGLSLFCNLGNAPVRQLHRTAGGRLFAIAGEFLYEIELSASDLGVATLMGTLDSSSGRVRMADNGLILFIAYATTAYRLRLSDNNFAKITDVNYLGGTFVEFLDQYFLVNRPSTQQFQISPLAYDGSQPWVAGDVFSAESSPDYLTRHIVNGREVWLFGPESYEVWFNTGDATRPFQRIRDAAVNVGTIAPNSVMAIQGRVFWLGSSKEGHGTIWGSNGYQPARVSNHGVEQIIAGLGYLDDAEAWSYQMDGHHVYALTFPSAGRTLCYDTTTDQWFEMEYRVPVTNARTRHRASCHAFAFGRNLVGDFENGKIYVLSKTTYTDNGDPIIRYRRSPHVQAKGVKHFYHYLELDAEPGVGLSSGQGSNPLVSLRFSDDGARTWSNYHTRTLGAIGKYKTRPRWARLGSSYARVFELTVSDPVPFSISGAHLGVTVGGH